MLKFLPFNTSTFFEYKDPDTGYLFTAGSMAELIKYVVNYRAQNKLAPIEHLRDSIEDYLCRKPQNKGNCYKYEIKRGLWEVAKGGVNVVKNIFLGEANMVSQEVADVRSEKCRDCPMNVFPDKDGFVLWSDMLAEASTYGKRSKCHDDLGNCAACSCPLRVKVWTKGPYSLDSKEKVLMETVKCWQVNDGES